MEAGWPLIKFLFPQVPSMSWAATQNALGLTDTAKFWDTRTAVTVHVLRSIMSDNGKKDTPSLAKIQKGTLREPGVKAKTWVATATIAKPPREEGDLREAIFAAVDAMKKEEVTYTKPECEDIEVEWTGYRPSAANGEPLPNISEEEKYKRMMAEPTRTSETTVLYFHGGAYYLCDPRTHRPLTSRLAKESNGRVCSVRYRLAPQTAFPGQLIDALMVYLSLLYPPPGSMHAAIPAGHIVLGGDSAGGNLSFGLLQLLLQMQRSTSGAVSVVKFHGRDVHVPLPAGVSANSGWFDISRAMPSLEHNAKYDYLPPATHDDAVSRFPTDSIWPTTPPRGDLFCDLSLLDHPLASLVLAESWENSPPLWLCTGYEMLADEDCLVASRAAQQGVKVQFEQYEAMPHCFAMLIPHLQTSNTCMRNWGDWARRCVESPGQMGTSGRLVHVKAGKEDKDIDVAKMPSVNYDEAWGLIKAAKMKRILGYQNDGKEGVVKPAL